MDNIQINVPPISAQEMHVHNMPLWIEFIDLFMEVVG